MHTSEPHPPSPYACDYASLKQKSKQQAWHTLSAQNGRRETRIQRTIERYSQVKLLMGESASEIDEQAPVNENRMDKRRVQANMGGYAIKLCNSCNERFVVCCRRSTGTYTNSWGDNDNEGNLRRARKRASAH